MSKSEELHVLNTGEDLVRKNKGKDREESLAKPRILIILAHRSKVIIVIRIVLGFKNNQQNNRDQKLCNSLKFDTAPWATLQAGWARWVTCRPDFHGEVGISEAT